MKKAAFFGILLSAAFVFAGSGGFTLLRVSSGAEYFSPFPVSEIVSGAVKISAKIFFENPDDGQKQNMPTTKGTGVVFGKYVITASHNFPKEYTVQVMTPIGPMTAKMPWKKVGEEITIHLDGGKTASAKILLDNPEKDIALLELSENSAASLPCGFGNSDKLRMGNSVYVFGNAEAMGINVREGVVSALTAPKQISQLDSEHKNMFMLSNGISSGDSGAPVVAFRNGKCEFVGLVVGVVTANNRLGWAIRVNVIRDLLLGAKEVPEDFKKFLREGR